MFKRQLFVGGVCLGCIALVSAGCTFSQVPGGATPTIIPASETPAPTTTPPPTVTLSPVPVTDTPQPVVEPTDTPLPPTATATATATPGPVEHTIQEGETLGFIIQLYGHRSFDVIDEVVRINETIPNADSLPGAGNTILIPRPTAEVVQAPAEADTTTDGDSAPSEPQQVSLSDQLGDAPTTGHVVQEGETVIDIAQQYNTTLEIVSQLNPDIGFFGCNFNIPSGGPDCVIILQERQEVRVPAPTPTPTLSPTPSGNETATPTPTYVAPLIAFPPDGAIVQPGRIRLQWVSAGFLNDDEVYLVYIKDNTVEGGSVNAFVTRSTALEVPAELIPQDGQPHTFEWWVTVGRQNAAGFYEDISGQPAVRQFQWRGSTE